MLKTLRSMNTRSTPCYSSPTLPIRRRLHHHRRLTAAIIPRAAGEDIRARESAVVVEGRHARSEAMSYAATVIVPDGWLVPRRVGCASADLPLVEADATRFSEAAHARIDGVGAVGLGVWLRDWLDLIGGGGLRSQGGVVDAREPWSRRGFR